VSVDIITR